MKKVIFTFLLTTISMLSFSQTKSETEEWIAQQLNLHTNDDILYKYSFVNGLLVTEMPMSKGSTLIQSIPIEQIGGVKYVEKSQSSVWLVVNCTNNSNCSFMTIKDKEGKSDMKNDSMNVKMNLILSSSFSDDDLPNRMKKAFNHLIKLYGGKVIENRF